MAQRGEDVATRNAQMPAWLTGGHHREDERIQVGRNDSDLVALFYALDTQWNIHPLAGVRTGINYTAIQPTAQLLGITMTPAMMPDLRKMESEALAAFARRRA